MSVSEVRSRYGLARNLKLVEQKFRAESIPPSRELRIAQQCKLPIVNRAFLVACVFFCFSSLCYGHKPNKRKPAGPAIIVIGAELPSRHWTHTFDLVDTPLDRDLLEPGQCVLFGIATVGEGHRQFAEKNKVSFEIEFNGKTSEFAPSFPQVVKDLRADGETVRDLLAAGGVRYPVKDLASLAVSQERWCVPASAQDGAVTITGTIWEPGGETVSLDPRRVQALTYDTVLKRTFFKDDREISEWMNRYHFGPSPAQLLPALRFMAADLHQAEPPQVRAFFVAALRDSPLAAEDISRRLIAESRGVQLFVLPILTQAGYQNAQTEQLLNGLTDSEKVIIAAAKLPDPYDATPDATLANRLDMLWATFMATGDFKPVRAMVNFLQWRDDYRYFLEARKAGTKMSASDQRLWRGLNYRAAGWSLRSFMKTDGVAADYIDFIKASPDTPAVIKEELEMVLTNPAFDR